MSLRKIDALQDTPNTIIKVFGIGGGGTNVVKYMIRKNFEGADLICVNTDSKALRNVSSEATLLQLGSSLTRGLGAGGNPEIGRRAAEEDKESIIELLKGADMVFIATGMGGGTGSGAAPYIAKLAKELDILTIAVVTRPFNYEGEERSVIAETAIKSLEGIVDSLIVISNQKLFSTLDKNSSLRQAFDKVDEILYDAVSSISNIILLHADIEIDFNDVKGLIRNMETAVLGIGISEGNTRFRDAMNMALNNPLLDDIDPSNMSGMLLQVQANNFLLSELQEVEKLKEEIMGNSTKIKLGVVEDENMENDALKVTLIASGRKKHSSSRASSKNNLGSDFKVPTKNDFNSQEYISVPSLLKNKRRYD